MKGWVRQDQDTGSWSRVLKTTLVNFVSATCSINSLLVEGLDKAITVMFGDEIPYSRRQPIFSSQFQPIIDVRYDDPGAAIWIQVVVRVTAILVFCEERRPVHLADVMIKGADPD